MAARGTATPSPDAGHDADGDYAYVPDQDSGELVVLDITDPQHPSEVGRASHGTAELGGDAAKSGDLLAVTGSNAYGDTWLSVVDVSDPENPSVTGNVELPGNVGPGVATDGAYAYIVDDQRFDVVDIGDPQNPSVVGSLTSTSDFDGAKQVIVDGDYAYATASVSDSFVVFDVSTPSSPSIADSISDGNLNGAYGLAKRADHVYVAAEDAGRLTVVDVSTPSSPTITGSGDGTVSNPKGVALGEDLVFVSARGSTVYAVDVSDPSAPSTADSLATESGYGFLAAASGLLVQADRSDGVLAIDRAPMGDWMLSESGTTGGFAGSFTRKTPITGRPWTAEVLGTSHSPVAVEDAEDGDIDEYSGDTLMWAATQNKPYEGSYSLEHSSDNRNRIDSYSGLPRYPSAGSTVEFRVWRPSDGVGEVRYNFGAQDASNHYQLYISRDGDSLTLQYISGGSSEDSVSDTGLSIPGGEWLRVVVDWGEDGTITATLYDAAGNEISSVTLTNAQYTEGGIGWVANEQPTYIDNLVITSSQTGAQPTVLVWGHDSETSLANGYAVGVPDDRAKTRLVRYTGGSMTVLDEVDKLPPAREWVPVEVQHDPDGSISATLGDITLSGTDTDHLDAGGRYQYHGVGLHAAAGDTDNLVDAWRQSLPVVEDWEAGDLSNWNGDTANWEVTTATPVSQPRYSAKPVDDDVYWLYSTDADPTRKPQPGDVQEIFFWLAETAVTSDGELYFFWASDANAPSYPDNYYEVDVTTTSTLGDGEIELAKSVNGTYTSLTRETISEGIPRETWIMLRIKHTTDGSFRVELIDRSGTQLGSSLTATDSDHITNGVYDQTHIMIRNTQRVNAVDTWRLR